MNPLPPEALDAWLAAAARELGIDASEVPIPLILDVAADVAHGVARPAAPLTAYLLGLALGRSGDGGIGAPTLEELAERVSLLAEGWEEAQR